LARLKNGDRHKKEFFLLKVKDRFLIRLFLGEILEIFLRWEGKNLEIFKYIIWGF